jgi:hypothetical protein
MNSNAVANIAADEIEKCWDEPVILKKERAFRQHGNAKEPWGESCLPGCRAHLCR